TLGVEWQVFSRLNKRVVFEARSEGAARSRGDADVDAIVDRSVLDAFASATRGLLADQRFYDFITGAGQEPAGPTAPGGAPAALFSIKHVPLSSDRFQDNVTDIRAHVATVFSGDGHGSGFFVNDGYLLTNWHVVNNSKFVKVRLVTGREIVGEVLVSNATRDVALIKTENIGLPGLPLRMEDP
ncbi:MAG: trypsin-like peptidase domain-containing protein, partial [Rhodospirillaceae bacterium]